jgi:predicted metal-dependent peptidase
MDFRKLMSKAKVGLLAKEKMIFFTHIIMGSKHLMDNSPNNQTAYTDGLNCYYNEEFFGKLTNDEREFLIAHEGLHIAFEHCTERAKGLDPDLWNRAADYVINLILTNVGMKMPAGGLCDPQYQNLSTLQVYRLLEEKGKANGSVGTMAGCALSDLREPKGPKEQEIRQQIKQQVEALVIRGKTMAEMAGKMPSNIGPDLQRLIDGILKPAIPWQRVLRRLMFAMTKGDFSWAKPNRRYQPMGMYLPSQYSPGLGPGSFGWDVSGSVTDAVFNFFVSETHHVLKRFNPDYIDVMQFDDQLLSKERIRNLKALLKIDMRGGGGTRIDELMLSYSKDASKWLIVLSDGYIGYLHSVPNPGKPVIWAIYDNPNFIPPFGQAVHFKMSEDD